MLIIIGLVGQQVEDAAVALGSLNEEITCDDVGVFLGGVVAEAHEDLGFNLVPRFCGMGDLVIEVFEDF